MNCSGCPKKFFEALRRAPQLDKWIHLVRASGRIPGGLFGRTCGQYDLMSGNTLSMGLPVDIPTPRPVPVTARYCSMQTVKERRKLKIHLRSSFNGHSGWNLKRRAGTNEN